VAPETIIAVAEPRGCGKNARALIYTLSGQFCVTEDVPEVVRKMRAGKPDANTGTSSGNGHSPVGNRGFSR
jgi:hypothetical protein